MIRVFGVPQTPAWVAVVLSAVGVCRADVVRTTDGRRLVGTVAVDGHGLRVGRDAIGLDDLLDVAFDRRTRAVATSCVLVDGTVLAGRIDGVDGRTVRVTTGVVGSVPVEAGRVARVCFTAVGGDLLGRVPAAGSGLLLRDGDFFDGAFERFDGTAVTMTSPLLGENTFGTADRAAAIVWRPVGPRAGDWTVRTNDGSVLVAEGLAVTNGVLRMDVAGVGPVAVRLSDAVAIRAGGNRAVELPELTPTAGTALADATPMGVPARLVGSAVERSVCVAGGTSATYRLGGEYAAFACRVGVPAGIVPTAGVKWAVEVDGRTVASGGPSTSVDDPAEVCVTTAGARELTLSVEPVAGGVGAAALFADPVLSRARGAATRSGKSGER